MRRHKLIYLGQCDELRRQCFPSSMAGTSRGEDLWQRMMLLRQSISLEEFEDACDISDLLDEDETLEQFLADDPKSGAYLSYWGNQKCMFIQSSGFEFIFTSNKQGSYRRNPRPTSKDIEKTTQFHLRTMLETPRDLMHQFEHTMRDLVRLATGFNSIGDTKDQAYPGWEKEDFLTLVRNIMESQDYLYRCGNVR